MEPGPNGFPIGTELASLGFEKKPLKRRVELSDGLFLVNPRVALKALQRCVHRERNRLREFRFPTPRRPLD
jgi:hypothetical protein